MKKSVKRMLSIGLSIILLFSMLSISVSANPTYTFNTTKFSSNTGIVPANSILFYEDFSRTMDEISQSMVVGQRNIQNISGTGKEVNMMGSGNGAGMANVSIGSQGCLKLTKVNTNNVYMQNPDGRASEYFSGKYVTEFKFKQDTLFAMESLFRAHGMSSSSDGDKTYKNPKLMLNDTGGLFFCDTVPRQIATIQAGKWYTVKLDMDVQNEVYDIYLNGLLIKANAAFGGEYTADAEWPADVTKTMWRFFLAAFANNAPEGSVISYDDIKVYREPTGRKTLWANDFSGYEEDVEYNASGSSLSEFAGLYNDSTQANSSASGVKINAEKNTLEFSKNSNTSIRGFKEKITDQVTMQFDFSTSALSKAEAQIIGIKDVNTFGATIFLQDDVLYVTEGQNADNERIKRVLLRGIVPEQTYTVTVHVDLTKPQDGVDGADIASDLTSKGVYDVYVDGVCAVSGMEVRDGAGQIANLAHVDRIFNSNMNMVDATISLTNMTLYKDVREEVMAEAGLAINKYLTRDNILTGDNIQLPVSFDGLDGYDVVWESSNPEAFNVETGDITQTDVDQAVTLTAKVADINGEYTLVRTFNIIVPNRYETNIAYENNIVIATVDGVEAEGKILFAAVHDGAGNLLGLDVVNISNDNYIATIDTSTMNLSKGKYTAKVYLWDSAAGLVPICNSRTTTFTIFEN